MILSKRVVIVTGGSSGIGRAIAEAFCRDGEQTVIIGRNESALRSTGEEIGASWVAADVSRRDDVERAIAWTVRRFGPLHVLVNNAGFVRGVTTEMDLGEAETEWDKVLGTNLKGPFLMAHAVAPHLVRPGGRIIQVSSIAACTGGSRAGSTAYAAAKAGLHGLTFGLARELSPQGITVNAVAPGFVAGTGFTGQWSQERVQWLVEQTATKRAGRPEDVAAAVHYLASAEASFVTGQILHVNGGWLFGR